MVKEKKMQAFSEKGKRVTTIIVPAPLQDKGNKQVVQEVGTEKSN